MHFYVNLDDGHNTAVVHRQHCCWAEARAKVKYMGEWRGPFETPVEALNEASNLTHRSTRTCPVCKP